MLMLQRAAENVNPSECNDPAVLLACSLGSDSCPAACQKSADEKSDEEPTPSNISDMPIAGDLSIAVADYSSAVKSAPSVGTVIFNAVDFKSSEKVVIESVKLERTGLSDKSNIKGVWFEKDGVAVSAKASLSTDGTVTTRFYNNYSVNGTDTLDLVAELSGSAGAEIAFKFVGATTTAKNVSLNTVTTTYRTTEYKVATAKFEINGGKSTETVEYKVGDTNSFEIGKFSITNDRPTGVSEDRDMIVKSIKLKNNEALDLADTFKNVYVTRDGKTVSKRVELDGKTMTIYFDDDQLSSGKKGVYTIFAEVAQLNEVGKSVQLYLNKYSELVAYEVASNFRAAYANNTDLTLKKYTFQGGKVTFSNDSGMSKTVNAAAGSSDVVLAKGTLALSEPVRLNKISFYTEDSTGMDTAASSSRIIKDLKLEIGGSTYNTSVKCTNTTSAPIKAECVYTTDDDEIYIAKTSDIRILANIRGNAANNATVKFTSPLKGASIKDPSHYDNSDEKLESKDIAGSIQIAQLTVKAGKFNLTNKSSTTKKVVKNSSDEVVIFDGEITAKEGRISVNDLTLEGEFYKRGSSSNTGLSASEQIDLTLYVDGEAFRTQTLRGKEPSKSFANLGDVESGKSMKIKIAAQPNIATLGYVDYMVSAKGTDAQGNDVEATQVSASRLQITDAASLTIASSSSESSVIRDGSNTEVLSFTTTVKDGTADLNEVKVEGTGFDMLTNVTLSIDGTDVDSVSKAKTAGAAGIAADGKSILFSALNETLKEWKHTFVLKSNVTAGIENDDSLLQIGKVTINDVTKDAKDLNINKLIAKSYPTISSKKDGDDLVLTISNPKDSDDDVEILGFLVDWDIVSMSIKWTSLTLTNGSLSKIIKEKNVSIAPDGQPVEFRLQAAKSSTATVKGIIIRADGQTLIINNDYTNVGSWANFKVTASGDQLPAKYFTLTSSDIDTTIAAKNSVAVNNITATNAWSTDRFVTTITAEVSNNTKSAVTLKVGSVNADHAVAAESTDTVTFKVDYATTEFKILNSTDELAVITAPVITLSVTPTAATITSAGGTTTLQASVSWATWTPTYVWNVSGTDNANLSIAADGTDSSKGIVTATNGAVTDDVESYNVTAGTVVAASSDATVTVTIPTV